MTTLKTAELPPVFRGSQLLDYVFSLKKKNLLLRQRLYAKHFFLPFPQFYCELKTALKIVLIGFSKPPDFTGNEQLDHSTGAEKGLNLKITKLKQSLSVVLMGFKEG